jgi:hypothetical protein
MNEISATVVIAAPADLVWNVVAHQFDRVGLWARAIPASRPVAGPPAVEQTPVPGRVCRTGLPMFPEITERIVAYDEAEHTLTYQADLVPGLLPVARNTWRVESITATRTRVSLHATVQTRNVAGRLLFLLLRPYLARTGFRFLADLRHYVEHGRPAPGKQRRLDRARSDHRRHAPDSAVN